jgi:DNA-directed RNA polymerase III subunit RPC3
MSQLSREVQMKPQTLRAAVIVLVQHNILWHASTPEGTEILEINIDECIARLYFGKYIWLARETLGHQVHCL